MTTKARIAKLERAVKPQKMTWKEFVTLARLGKTTPEMQADWQKFIQKAGSYEHKKPTE